MWDIDPGNGSYCVVTALLYSRNSKMKH